MRSYIERAKDFVRQIYPFIECAEFGMHEMIEQVELFNEQYNRKVVLRHGIARVALITSDYVVKYDYDPEEVSYVGGGEAEVAFYAIAKREGFAYLFAEITRFEYCGHLFYIMPRIRGINSDSWFHADHYMTQEEIDWCDRHRLSDLHCNNYGFRKGKVCIIDYACSLEETDYSESESEVSES